MSFAQELRKVFGQRRVNICSYVDDVEEGFRASLQCVPYDPSSVAEHYVGDGTMRDEPGPSGPDDGEHRMIVVQKGGSYFAHWLPDSGEIDVYVEPNSEDAERKCLAAVRRKVAHLA